jgi:hypothetical protein
MSSDNPLKKIRSNSKQKHSADTHVFHADAKYLKNISRNDNARPSLLPIALVFLALLSISVMDGLFYFNKISEWLASFWNQIAILFY